MANQDYAMMKNSKENNVAKCFGEFFRKPDWIESKSEVMSEGKLKEPKVIAWSRGQARIHGIVFKILRGRITQSNNFARSQCCGNGNAFPRCRIFQFSIEGVG